jgi:ribosomal-protein-alanine acetyltransferase
VKIRCATSADVATLISLERSCPTAAHWGEQQYQEAFQESGMRRFVLIAEGASDEESGDQSGADRHCACLGFLIARGVAAEWELENIVVAEPVRRKRVGSQLLEALLQYVRERSGEAVFLEVRASNLGARNLYEKAGFMATGRRKSYYADPLEDAILYKASV